MANEETDTVCTMHHVVPHHYCWTPKWSLHNFSATATAATTAQPRDDVYVRRSMLGAWRATSKPKTGKVNNTITTKESTFTLYKYTRKREKAPQNKIVEFRSFTDYRHTGFNVWEHTQTIQGGAVAQVNIVSLLFLLYVELIHFSSGVHRLLLIEMKTSAAHSDDRRTHTIASLLMHIVHCGGCWYWWWKSMLPSGKQTAEGITSFCDLLCGIYETIRYCFSAYCVRCMGEYVKAKW